MNCVAWRENRKASKMQRKIWQIAAEVIDDMMAQKSIIPWQIRFAQTYPYVCAMRNLNTLEDIYHFDKATDIVNYFLANASTWRGETARRIKKELNDMLKARK
jgi:hypothetical protein